MRHHTEAQEAMTLPELRLAPLERIARFVFDRFLLLPLGAALAVVWANVSPESYFRFARALDFPVNEIAMALFLALMAQEVYDAMMPGGALHTWRRWGMALVAAGGGLAGAYGAYVIYVGMSHQLVLRQGWPIAGAVDVAAAYYVIKSVWRRSAALPFVLLIALASDAAGVVAMALRPRGVETHPAGLVLVLAAVAAAAMLRRRRVHVFWPYLALCGPLAWWGLYLNRIHPALALIPIVPLLPHAPRRLEFFADPHDTDDVHHFEQRWNVAVQLILFTFGLVNAGVMLRGYDTGTWALLTALLVGRPVGILAAVAVAVALGFHLPRRLGWPAMIVIALAMSSGFTFALFFSVGLVPVGPMLAELKLGALLSVVAAPAALLAARAFGLGRYSRKHHSEAHHA
ncbi:MAG TPA: Na+/H+ antiporter NhaA [Vicinamibacterales bacterium]|nr:Na+/H+ antiporter NhaA [Vicinamibacterales bacterium]